MSRKWVYEVARDHGMSSLDLLDELQAAGINATTASSTVEVEEVEALLHADGDGSAEPLDRYQPAERIREYVEAHGPTTVPIHNLLTSWRHASLTRRRCQEMMRELAEAGVRVDPPLDAGRDPSDPVRLKPSEARALEPPSPPVEATRARVQRPRREPDKAVTTAPSSHPRPGWPRRISLRLRLRRLRRRYDVELRDFGGLVFETRRLEVEREKLIDDKLEQLRATSARLTEIEEQLGNHPADAVCPKCGFYTADTRVCLACGYAYGPRAPGAHPERMSAPLVAFALVLLTGAWLLGGIVRGGDEPTKTRAAAAPPHFRSLVAHVRGRGITVYRSPSRSRRLTRLSNPNADGAPLAFLVKRLRPPWAYVYLPTRPNGSFGWIRENRVRLAVHSYRLVLNLRRHRLTAYRAGRVFMRKPIGTGQAVTPTPTGTYYITELLRQPDPSGIYGPFAFGLSAHSNVLHEFAGADGILGLHGTDFPQGIGTDVSHGCIRVRNSVIRRLAKILPVGTPVRITRA